MGSNMAGDGTQETPQRDEKGRLLPGHKPLINPESNSKRRFMYRDALYQAVTVEDIADVLRKLVKEAKNGDVRAAKELLDRAMGRPQLQLEDVEDLADTFPAVRITLEDNQGNVLLGTSQPPREVAAEVTPNGKGNGNGKH